jgi:hypothetical protein
MIVRRFVFAREKVSSRTDNTCVVRLIPANNDGPEFPNLYANIMAC